MTIFLNIQSFYISNFANFYGTNFYKLSIVSYFQFLIIANFINLQFPLNYNLKKKLFFSDFQFFEFSIFVVIKFF